MEKIGAVTKGVVHNLIEHIGLNHRSRQRLKGQLIILTYHSFCKSPRNGLFASLPIVRFEEQIRYLKEFFDVVSVTEGIKLLASQDSLDSQKPMLAITIDDGFEDNYLYAYPILKKYKVPATIFLATDFLNTGRVPWPTQILDTLEQSKLDKLEFPFSANIATLNEKAIVVQCIKYEWANLSPDKRFENIQQLKTHLKVPNDTKHNPLSWSQVKEMRLNGIEFGAHSVFHSILSSVEPQVVEQELKQSKLIIEEKIQKSCHLFAYPDGGYNNEVKQMTQNCGYIAALTQAKGINNINTDLMAMHRVEIPYNEDVSSFRCRVNLTAPNLNKIRLLLKNNIF